MCMQSTKQTQRPEVKKERTNETQEKGKVAHPINIGISIQVKSMTAIVFLGGSRFFLFVPAIDVDDEATVGIAVDVEGPGVSIAGSRGGFGSTVWALVLALPGAVGSAVTTVAGIVKLAGAGKVCAP